MKEMVKPSVQLVTFEEVLEKDGVLVYTNVGYSMMPLLRQHRDLIEIRKTGVERCKKYDAVLYKQSGKYILHRIIKVRPNDYVIVGDHCFRREYGITDKQILGIMTRVIRDGKSIYPTDWKYKLYVHLWCDFYPVRAAILYSKMRIRAAGGKIKRLLFGRRKTEE